METFLFASGIENSDQMDACGHYARWEEDLALARDLGLNALRYGPAYYRTHTGPDLFDWNTIDEPMARLRELGLTVIADLCHSFAPSWLGGFDDPAFPVLFAEYARAFARRYTWVRHFTPIDEIFVRASHVPVGSFVPTLRNLCMAHELAVEAIVAERPDAIIVQTESHALALDLTLGHELRAGMAGYLNRHGVTSNDLRFFRERRFHPQRWIGLDRLSADYYRRYRLPLFHCFTNYPGGEAPVWLAEQWREALVLRSSGVPITGFTWYPLTDRVEPNKQVLPVGLYDLGRRIRPVGEAYRDLIARWTPVLAVVAELELHPKVLRA